VSAHADAVKDVIDVNVPNRYGPIRVEDVHANDFIRPENPGSSNNSICDGLAFSS